MGDTAQVADRDWQIGCARAHLLGVLRGAGIGALGAALRADLRARAGLGSPVLRGAGCCARWRRPPAPKVGQSLRAVAPRATARAARASLAPAFEAGWRARRAARRLALLPLIVHSVTPALLAQSRAQIGPDSSRIGGEATVLVYIPEGQAARA